MHQLSHLWIDFRGIQDAFMRRQAIDYFENSRRATYVNQQYAIRNPKGFRDYGQHAWGITASNGPGPTTRRVRGVTRRFLGYVARGVPYGPDDGTLAPWAVVASLPFAPEIVLPTLQHCVRDVPEDGKRVRARLQFQSDVSESRFRRFRLDLAKPLRARSGAGHPDDRELSLRVDLAAHAELSIRRRGPAPRGVQGRLVDWTLAQPLAPNAARNGSVASCCRRRNSTRRVDQAHLDADNAEGVKSYPG